MATWLITGISRGLGRALANAVLAEGHTVIGTTRNGTADLEAGAGELHVLAADFAAPEAALATVEAAFALSETIDVIVNNAGYGLLGAVETSTDEELRRLFEIDVFTPIRLVRAALPRLRAQGAGHVINVTSIAGRAPGAGSVLYAAAKHALEGFSAALAQEIAPLGLHVTAVAPGAFRTDFLSDHSIRRSGAEDTAYGATVGRMSAAFASMHGKQLGDPDRAAAAIIALVKSEAPPVHLLLGSDALARTRSKLDAIQAEISAWEQQTVSTDFADAK